MDRPEAEIFPELQALPGIAHCFILRQAGIELSLDRAATLSRLQAGFDLGIGAAGLSPSRTATAEQVHGGGVEVATDARLHLGADGLITNVEGLALGIVVADCCAVYLVDPVRRAIGLVHSGKKGTEAGISQVAIQKMAQAFGTLPGDLLVRLSPCIRPPAYEIDIARLIREQLKASGVAENSIFDDGLCTTSDPHKYYSYRAESGATGRMLAVLGVCPTGS